ncbi:hypothetical protein K2X85_03455 [bacterium]|nr:hypothetical protein [bacterium]
MTKIRLAERTEKKGPVAQNDLARTDRRERAERSEDRQDRRLKNDRRKKQIPVAVDRRQVDRRVGERRRQIDPTTCEREYNNEEMEFMKAIEDYKRDFRRPFPTWSEILEVVKALGYRRVAESSEIVANRAKATIVDDCAL